jgi:hypothetical protein
MPRKKTVQPDPKIVHESKEEDGLIWEERGPGSYIIGRGLHKRDAHEELRAKVLDWVVDHYLSIDGPIKVKNDFMKTASGLDIAMDVSGKFPEVTDIGVVRKRIYPWVRDHLAIVRKLVEEKNSKKTST